MDLRAPARVGLDLAIVDEPEVHDVDGDLRVVNGLQDPDDLLSEFLRIYFSILIHWFLGFSGSEP